MGAEKRLALKKVNATAGFCGEKIARTETALKA